MRLVFKCEVNLDLIQKFCLRSKFLTPQKITCKLQVKIINF